MPLAKSTITRIINLLGVSHVLVSLSLFSVFTLSGITAFSQDNSPYSRYGLGDLVPSTNINSRGMGSISAGYSDILSINFSNPASYGSFQTIKQPGTKKISSGRAILDVGINLENRTLREPNTVEKFTASNLLVSHVEVGVPLKPNWGLVFGLRPVTRISYKMINYERLHDPNTGLPIDSAYTLSEGDGGGYLPNVGTGFRIPFKGNKQFLSFGVNAGYLFGEKDYSTRRAFINDTVEYNAGNFQTTTNYNNFLFTGGMQFQTALRKDITLTIGAFGNIKTDLNASQNIIRETYVYDQSIGNLRLDSVAVARDIKGKITYPSSFTAGFVIERIGDIKESSWLFGIDYMQNKWSEYRFYGQVDPTVRDKWELRVGGQLRPASKATYFSNVAYRAGFFMGPDYIYAKQQKLPVLGVTLGMGLPVGNYNRLNWQRTIINVAMEYVKRGDNDNLMKENLFRLSVGLSLSDLWFIKKKYD